MYSERKKENRQVNSPHRHLLQTCSCHLLVMYISNKEVLRKLMHSSAFSHRIFLYKTQQLTVCGSSTVLDRTAGTGGDAACGQINMNCK